MADQNTNMQDGSQATSTTAMFTGAQNVTESISKSVSSDSTVKQPTEEQKTTGTAPVDAKQAGEAAKDPVAVSGQTEEQPQDSRDLQEARRKMQQTGEELNRMLSANVKLVEKNPELLSQFAETDPLMADKIVKKLGNYNSYKEYTEVQKIEALKDENPDMYEMKKDFFEMKREREAAKQEKRTQTETEFFGQHDIIVNPFDPRYQKVQDQMANLSQKFVQENYQEALKVAFSMAYPDQASQKMVDRIKVDAALSNQSIQAGRGSKQTTQPGSQMPEISRKMLESWGVPITR